MSSIIRIVFLATVFFSIQGFSLLEINLGYGGIVSNSAGGNWIVPGLSMSGAYGLQGDIRFELPLTGVGLGLRYSKMGLDGTSGSSSVTMSSDIYSALLAYRFINTGLLLGVVGTYSLSASGSLKNSLASPSGPVTAGSVSQYTAGLEVGIKIPILIAAELGVGNLSMSSFSNQTLLGNATNVSLNGTYARASVGFSF